MLPKKMVRMCPKINFNKISILLSQNYSILTERKKKFGRSQGLFCNDYNRTIATTRGLLNMTVMMIMMSEVTRNTL